jgi:hypothetical protein
MMPSTRHRKNSKNALLNNESAIREPGHPNGSEPVREVSFVLLRFQSEPVQPALLCLGHVLRNTFGGTPFLGTFTDPRTFVPGMPLAARTCDVLSSSSCGRATVSLFTLRWTALGQTATSRNARDVRFTPNTGYPTETLAWQLRARSDQSALQQNGYYSITSSARTSSDAGDL